MERDTAGEAEVLDPDRRPPNLVLAAKILVRLAHSAGIPTALALPGRGAGDA
jgi:hypothetical protein